MCAFVFQSLLEYMEFSKAPLEVQMIRQVGTMIEASLLGVLLLLKNPNQPLPPQKKTKPKTLKKTEERKGREKLEDSNMFIPLGNNSLIFRELCKFRREERQVISNCFFF